MIFSIPNLYVYTFLSPHLAKWTWASRSHSDRSLFRFSEWNFAILDGSPGMFQKVLTSTKRDNKIKLPPKKCEKVPSTSEFTIPTRLPACRTLVNGGMQQFVCWNPKIQTRIWRTIIFLLKFSLKSEIFLWTHSPEIQTNIWITIISLLCRELLCLNQIRFAWWILTRY